MIFNQMSPMLYPRMKKLVEEQLDVEVLGYVPKVEDCVIESRHLGLVLPEEIPELKSRLQKLSEVLEKTLISMGSWSLQGSTGACGTRDGNADTEGYYLRIPYRGKGADRCGG